MKKILIALLLFTEIYAELIPARILSPVYSNRSVAFNAIAVSVFDNIFLTDHKNHEIIKLNSDGKLLNTIGGLGWDESSLNFPTDIAINSGLNIILCDKNNHRLVRYDKNLNFISTLPGENSFQELNYPHRCEITKKGSIFILQENSYDILKLNFNDESFSTIGSNVDKEFELQSPIDIFLTQNQNLIILEQSGKILKYDEYGSPLEILNLKIDHFLPKKIMTEKQNIYLLSDDGKIYQKKNHRWIAVFQQKSHRISDFYLNDNTFFLLTEKGEILICPKPQD